MAGQRSHSAFRPVVLPPDELPSATGSDSDRPQRTPDGRWALGNTEARRNRVRPGRSGLAGIDATLPEFKPFARWGGRYASHRRTELAQSHGGQVSAGVGAIIESAGLAMAASRFLHSRAAQTGDAELFKQAAALAQTARQHELAAWELAAREAAARPKSRNAVLAAIEAAGGNSDG